MKTYVIGGILCFISTASCFGMGFSNIQSNSIDRTATIGRFVNVGTNVVGKAFSKIGSFSSIAPNTVIGENASVGSFTQLGSQCQIGDFAYIQDYANIGNGVSIGSGSNIGSYCTVGNDAKVENNVKIDQYSSVAKYCQVGDSSVIDMYGSIGSNAKLEPRSYVGMYSSVGPSAVIGQSAIIEKFVEIPNGFTVGPYQVAIRTLTSFDLFQMVTSSISNDIISTEFNDMLRTMIGDELNALTSTCAQSNYATRPQTLPHIIALYLTQYYGIERFRQYVQQVKQNCNIISNGQSIIIVNGVRMNPPQQNTDLSELKSQYHFEANSTNNILQSDVVEQLVQLLAIDQDAQRGDDTRPVGDSYCLVIEQLRNGTRGTVCITSNTPQTYQTYQIRSNYC